jgi:hypothetical protein
MHLTRKKKKKNAYTLSSPYTKQEEQKEMSPFICGGSGSAGVGSSKRLRADVDKQKVTDKTRHEAALSSPDHRWTQWNYCKVPSWKTARNEKVQRCCLVPWRQLNSYEENKVYCLERAKDEESSKAMEVNN